MISFTTFFSVCSVLASSALAHIEMQYPGPLRSKFNSLATSADVDYNMNAPLQADGSNFPCRGYQNDRPVAPVVTWTAGSTYNMTLFGSATHLGGSCQLSLSYDNGATFKVIKSMIGGCPLTETYDFTIPTFAPSGTALFAWTWLNHAGNREFYMNCAQVKIEGGGSNRRSKRAATAHNGRHFRHQRLHHKRDGPGSMDELPEIWKANMASINTCTTTANTDVVFPHPGPDVVYASGMSSSSPVDGQAGCDNATPGPMYKNLGDSTPSNPGGIFAPSAAPPLATLTTVTDIKPTQSIHFTTITDSKSQMYPTTTTTVTVPISFSEAPRIAGPGDVTVTVTSSSSCESTTFLTVTMTASAASASFSTASSVAPSQTSPPPSNPSPPTPITNPPYASSDDLSAYYPCTPNTFLCTSNTTFVTCVSSTSYISPDTSVAEGMYCLPFSSPSNTTTPSTYRDDRVVRARPYGDCDTQGQLACRDAEGETEGPSESFMICDNGGWIDMGATAAGTVCTGGIIGYA